MTRINDRWRQFITGCAWLKMPIVDGEALLRELAATPEFGEQVANARHTDSWTSYVWMSPNGLLSWTNLYFPTEQLPELAALLPTLRHEQPAP